MTKAAIQISASYKIPESYRAELANANMVYGHTAPDPDALGGYFDFTDWRGRAVSKANFLGRWTLLYFGYARCEGTCRTAAPLIADAARELRDLGLPARAAFVDIDSPPLGMIQRIDTDGGEMTHGSNWSKRYAMGWMALRHGADLEVLSGGRFQLGQATAAYHVLREHVPARASESGLSINHSSTIFLIGPDTMVAGYGYHDMGTERIVELVQRLNEAERNPIDLTAIRERYIRGVCGA
jgi:cytochrome oxidase Cu insertion factor (SCO1/SenC/PrrC family)